MEIENEIMYEVAHSEVADEVIAARTKFGPMHSPHEGFAVLLEEVDELWDEVRCRAFDPEKARKEAIQIAAMAICFAAEVCEPSLPYEDAMEANL